MSMPRIASSLQIGSRYREAPRTPRHWGLLLGLVCFVAAGCEPGIDAQPVTGKVTLKGEAAPENTRVNFFPTVEDGQAASGIVDAQGNYTLTTGSSGEPGAIIGKYKVYVTADASDESYMDAGNSSGVPGVVTGPFPSEWTQPATTPKEVEVTAGENTINIEIP